LSISAQVEAWLGACYRPPAVALVAPRDVAEVRVATRRGLPRVRAAVASKDATRVWLTPPGNLAGPGFAVELKPKAFRRARSWLVAPAHAALKAGVVRVIISRAGTGRALRAGPVVASFADGLDFDGVAAALAAPVLWGGDIVAALGARAAPSSLLGCAEAVGVAEVMAAALARERGLLERLAAAQQRFDCLDIDGVASALVAPALRGVDVAAALGSHATPGALSECAAAAARACRSVQISTSKRPRPRRELAHSWTR